MASLGGRAIKMSPPAPERVCGHFVDFLDELRGGNQSWTGAGPISRKRTCLWSFWAHYPNEGPSINDVHNEGKIALREVILI